MARLIHPRTEKELLQNLLPIPPEHLAIAQQWKTWLDAGTLDEETSNHGHFSHQIVVNLLGYQPQKEVYAEYPIDDGDNGRVDLALGEFADPANIRDRHANRCHAPLELKGAKTRLDAIMPGRHKTPTQQAWEYATKIRGCSWVMVSNYREIRLYGYGYGQQNWESFALDRLDDPQEYTKFIKLLHRDNLVGGKTKEWLERSEQKEKEIRDSLYKDYSNQRHALIDIIRARNPKIDLLQTISLSQTLLDRILFLAFAEDNQNLIPPSSLESAFQFSSPYDPKPKWENFKALFRAVDQGSEPLRIPKYNGGLFADNPILNNLTLPDEVFAGLRCLWGYDFSSEVSVTVLGHIFEQSITDLEKLRNPEAEVKIGARKKGGVVYTPPLVTSYIVDETIGAILAEKQQQFHHDHPDWVDADGFIIKQHEIEYWKAWYQVLLQLKIVDPACGSGAFLVAAFDYLAEEYQRVNLRRLELDPESASNDDGSGDLIQQINHKTRQAVQAQQNDSDLHILTHNLYGVDINSESVEITKLSLWLKTAKRGKILTDLGHTIQRGDSLIADPDHTQQAFDWSAAFPAVFAAGGFDAVIGNPPYVRMELIKHMKPYFEKHYKVVADRIDLYAYFFERGLQILKEGGSLGFISSSTFFKTGSGQKLRQYLLHHATLTTIVDFGDLQVFEGVTTYPAILIMTKTEPRPDSELTFSKLIELPEKLTDAVKAKGKTLLQSNLNSIEGWHLEGEGSQALRQKIVANHPTLKQAYGSPLYGIKTGLNKAFVIDRPTRDRLISEDSRSSELLKSFLEGKDLKKWHTTSRDLYIIYIPKNTIDIDDYPSIKEYLIPFKEELEKRATNQEWFELQQAQYAYYDAFIKPKIVYPDISQGPKFSLDHRGSFTGNTCYFIETSEKFIAGLLNSKLNWFYLKGICEALRGGEWRLRLFSINIETIPIPEATDEQKQRIGSLAETCQAKAEAMAKLDLMITRRLKDLAPKSWGGKLSRVLDEWPNLDFKTFHNQIKKDFKTDIPLKDRDDWQDYLEKQQASYRTLSQEFCATEQILNEEVYALFDLNPDEIALIENGI